MRAILFTIVMPSLNAALYLERALRSVINQACEDTEVLVIDGGSTDGSVELIRCQEQHLAWWCSEHDGGQSAALNKGLTRARGRYLLWLNADDLLLPGTLSAARQYLSQHAACDWLAGNLVYIDEQDRVLWCARDGGWHDWLYRQAPVRVYGPTSFFRRDLFEQVGGFDETLQYAMDTDLWLRFKAAGTRFERLSHYCWAFRVHAGSRTTPDLFGRPDPRMAAEQMRIYQKNGLTVTWGGLWRQRLWRVVNGCYARAWYDTRRWRGNSVVRLNATAQ
jgi:glycosyltransferase involved in cell wall biosynthesis